MLEQCILCKFLRKSFDHVTLNDLGSTEGGNDQTLQVKDKQKKLQQLKRAKVDSLFQTYEYNIVHYEHQYRQEFIVFGNNCLNQNHVDGISMVDSVKTYMANRMNQIKCHNRWENDFFSDKIVSLSPSFIANKGQHYGCLATNDRRCS